MITKFKKAITWMMTSVMMISSFSLLSGCKSVVDDGIHIPENAPWYNTVKFELHSPYDDVDLTYGMTHTPVYLNDNLYVLVTGEKRFDYKTALNDPNFDYNSLLINSVLKYDLSGNFIEEVALNLEESFGINNYQVTGISEYDGKLKINALATNTNTWATSNYITLLNPKSGKIESCTPFDIGEGLGSDLEATVKVGDYEVNALYISGMGKSNYQLVITRGSEIINTIDVGKTTGIYLWDISQIFAVDNDTVLMKCHSDDGKMTGTLKVSKGELSLTNESMDILDEYDFATSQDGKSYAVNSEGIWSINKNSEVESALSFTSALINANKASTSQVVHYDNDTAILFTQENSFTVTLPPCTVYILTKAKTNPNAGKTILDVYVLSDCLSYSEAESIVQFNSSNPEYFAKVRYAGINPDINTEEEIENINNVTNQLMTDIIDGTGPDVILDSASVQQLNKPDYLLDLSTFVKGSNGIDESKYFSKIIDNASSSDGALYQFPLSFSIGGILAYQSDVEDGRVGFTFEEYKRFIDTVCNGNNPISGDKFDFLSDCIARGYVDYIVDGKIDFNTAEFKAIAEYAKENIYDVIAIDEEEDYLVMGYTDPLADGPINTVIHDAESFIYQAYTIHEPFGMFGYPGMTGNDGPTAYINSSAAISATIEPEVQAVSWEFIKTMLSEEVQMFEQDGNPINIEAYKNCAKLAVDLMNAQYDSYINVGYDEAELNADGMTRTDERIVDYLVDIANSVTSVNSIDTAVKMILFEEIAAYFANQKDIDTVIQIINNRIQTVVDERGIA